MSNPEMRMNKAEEEYKIVKGDNEKLMEILEFLSSLKERIEPLSSYYFEEWMDDLMELEKIDFHNEVTNQDSIYEEIAYQYDLMKRILLVCAEYINADNR